MESTIDLSKVAGFKAVDAEGNEMGIVSMADLTSAISEQVLQTVAMRNQVMTLEEPAVMAAGTLAAGNDAYENELPEQTDLKWARALDAFGNPILISKESLASVVGELIGISTSSSYPTITAADPARVGIVSGKCHLISINYPYDKQGALVYVKSYGEFIILDNTLSSALSFEMDNQNSMFVIKATGGTRGILIRTLCF